MNDTATRTEFDGIYEMRGYTIVRANFGHGTEWAVHRGDVDEYFGSNSMWEDTFATLRAAKEWIISRF